MIYTLWLSEGYLRQGKRERARELVEGVLATSRELGYRHLEGVAGRLLGECLTSADPAEAARHLERATRILDDIGARNDLAKTLVAQAELARSGGGHVQAGELLDHALQIFQSLGTLDEPTRVQTRLHTQ